MMARTARALMALGAITVLLVVPPVLLLSYIGNPWPAEGVSLAAPLTDGAVVGALAVVVWTLWAQMAWCLVAEATAMLTKDRLVPPVALTFGVQQHLARQLVAAVVLATVAASLASALTPAPADASPAPAASTAAPRQTPPAPAATAAHDAPQQLERPAHHAVTTSTVTVMRLDSLWSIAERTLGDGERWSEIAVLNEGRTMADGSTFASADQIRPGWQLAVPTGQGRAEPGAQTQSVVVEPGDTLSQIAADRLDDPGRYTEIFRASTAIEQPDGRHLVDPDRIDVGWTLVIPASGTVEDPPERGPVETPTKESPTIKPDEPKPASTPPSRSPSDAASRSPLTDAEISPLGEPDRMATPGDDEQDDGAGPAAPWMLAGLTGAGALLGGGLHLAVRSRRRRQVRGRHPGRVIGRVDAELIDADKSIWVSEPAATTLLDLDALLRELAAERAERGLEMPAVAAVELRPSSVTLHLIGTAELSPPWLDADGAALRWRTAVGPSRAAAEPSSLSHVDPPYPLLVTMGASDDDATWLANLEELGQLALRGDPDRCLDLARYLLSELALSPWSGQARIACVGLSDAEALSDRVAIYPPDTAERAASAVLDSARQTIERAQRTGGTPPTGRTGQLDDDVWQAHCLLLVGDSSVAASTALRELIHQYPGQSGSAIVEVCPTIDSGGVNAELGPDGLLEIPQFGLRLRAASLTSSEAEGCAALLRAYEESAVSLPTYENTAVSGWEALADLTGAPRAEWTKPREDASLDEVSSQSVLPEPEALYADDAAVTVEDVRNLAPVVDQNLVTRAARADPTLDQDVADWFDHTSRRPRLTLLGPVSVRAYGVALTKRKPYFTEMLAFLALRRRHGVTASDLADTFNIEVRKARIYVNTLRDWLGADPCTGVLHLPHADKSPSARETGVPAYQLSEQLLIDSELFRRLRLRGQSRGAEGLPDLSRALDLVTGRPFDQLRPGGWSWLLDGERLDHYASSSAADVALLVAADALARGDLATARRAAEIGLAVAPDEDSAQLVMVRVLAAEGSTNEAASRLTSVQNRADDDGAPERLPDRIDAIARRLEQSG